MPVIFERLTTENSSEILSAIGRLANPDRFLRSMLRSKGLKVGGAFRKQVAACGADRSVTARLSCHIEGATDKLARLF